MELHAVCFAAGLEDNEFKAETKVGYDAEGIVEEGNVEGF